MLIDRTVAYIDNSTQYSPGLLTGRLQSEYGVMDFDQLNNKVKSDLTTEYIVEKLIPRQSLNGVFGISGVGKSPFIYQMLICVATGTPFLGLKVKMSRVLYLGSEDGLSLTRDKLEQIAKGLGVTMPKNLHVMSLSNTAADYGKEHDFYDIIRAVEPLLVVIDTVSAFCQGIEDNATKAIAHILKLKRIISETKCAIIFVHHLRKSSADPKMARTPLQKTDLTTWFDNVRGAGGLIGNIDTRIGFDKATTANADVVIRGRLRGLGEFFMLLSRETDSDGEYCGYRRLSGVDQLPNPEYQTLYHQLPARFRFTDVQAASTKGASSTKLFIDCCLSVGILRKEHKEYVKVLDDARKSHEEGTARFSAENLKTDSELAEEATWHALLSQDRGNAIESGLN